MSGRAAATQAPPRGPGYVRAARRPSAQAPEVGSEARSGTEAVRPEVTAAGLLVLFLGSLLLPVYFDVAGLRLTPIRVFLLLGFVPLVIRWLSGAAGRITAGDVFFCLHGAWIGIALFAVHGPSRLAFAGISIVEVLGAYLAGRVLIRNVTDYRTFFRYFLIALALLAPFVLMENLTGRLYFSQLLKPLDTLQKVQAGYADMRMGLFRAQGVVDHPILWGVLCSLGIGNAYFLWQDTPVRRLILAGFAGAMTFTSLSSGPLLAVTLQVIMIGWGWVTRNAWWALVGLAVLAYVGIDVLSNRSPIPVLISYLTFNPGNAYMRLLIWDFGSAEVLRHPLFGIGLNNWTRPIWMAASVDNFWLNTGMRYGLPGVLLLVAGIVANLTQIMRADLPDSLKPVRLGHVITMAGTLMVLWTVHIWGSTAVLVLFYFGSGVWLFTGTAEAGAAAPAPAKRAADRASGRRGGVPAADPAPDPPLPLLRTRCPRRRAAARRRPSGWRADARNIRGPGDDRDRNGGFPPEDDRCLR